MKFEKYKFLKTKINYMEFFIKLLDKPVFICYNTYINKANN